MKFKATGLAVIMALFVAVAVAQRTQQAHLHVNNGTSHNIRVTVDGNPFGSLQYIIPNGTDDDYLTPGRHTIRAVATDNTSLAVEQVVTLSAGDNVETTVYARWR